MPTILHVPEPCPEAWEAMPPAEGGRACGVCGHTVPDLSAASDAELVALVARDALPRCARFTAGQLDRALRAPARDPVQALQLTVMSALLLLPSTGEAKDVPSSTLPDAQRPLQLETSPSFVMGDIAPLQRERTRPLHEIPPPCTAVMGVIGPAPAPPPLPFLGDPAPAVVANEAAPDRPVPDEQRSRPALLAVLFRHVRWVRGRRSPR